MVTAVRHTGIVVSDLARELYFYRDLLGMEVWADFVDDSPYIARLTRLAGAKIHMMKLRAADGVSIELLQYLSHPTAIDAHEVQRASNGLGCSHIALQVSDIDALYACLCEAGVEFHAPPLISSDGGAKVTYCRDPEGVIIELVELLTAPAGASLPEGETA